MEFNTVDGVLRKFHQGEKDRGPSAPRGGVRAVLRVVQLAVVVALATGRPTPRL